MRKFKLTIVMLLIVTNIYADVEGQKSVAIGVAIAIAITVFWFIVISIDNYITRDKNAEHLEEEKKKLEKEIFELNKIHRKGIIDDNEYNTILNDLKKRDKELMLNYLLTKNQDYIDLQKALTKGYINQQRFDEKLLEINEKISRDNSL